MPDFLSCWLAGLIHCTDPKYEEEVSGCTATVAVITKDKIYCVCHFLSSLPSYSRGLISRRPTRATQEPFSESRAEQSPSPSTTSHKTKVRYCAPTVRLL